MPKYFSKKCCAALGTFAFAMGLGLSTEAQADTTDLRAVQIKILQAIAAKNYASAIAQAEAFEPTHPHHRARVMFIKGLIAKAQGNMPAAIKLYRGALADDPSLFAVRQELAAALFADGDYEAARYNLDILSANTTNPRLQKIYANTKAAMDQNKPWSINGYFNLAPSSNVNKGSSNAEATLFDIPGWQIDPTQQKQSGVGVATGLSGSYNFRIDSNYFVTAAAGLDATFYLDPGRNNLRVNTSLKPGFTTDDKSFRFSVGPYASASFANGGASYFDYLHSTKQYGLDGDFTAVLDQSLVLSFSGTALYQKFVFDSDRDGMRLDGSLRLTKILPENLTLGLTAGATFEGAQPALIELQHVDWRVGINSSKEWQGGWITGVEASFANHTYDGLILGKNTNRVDWVPSAGIQISNRNFSAYGFMPILSYSYTRQFSNDEFADYDSHDISIGLTRQF